MDRGLLRRLANACKDYYVLRTIDDLFIYAGAEPEWCAQQSPDSYDSQRVARFYAWVEGIQSKAPHRTESVMRKVVQAILSNPDVSETVRSAISEGLPASGQSTEEKGIVLDSLLATLARVLAKDGLTRELVVITTAEASLEWVGHDQFGELDVYCIQFCVPFPVYSQIEDDVASIEQRLLERVQLLVRAVPTEAVSRVMVTPKLLADNDWRTKASAWLSGQGVSNQGRVRSDNVASRTCDGLQFRSEPEIALYKALKAAGVSFAPLPVFVRGGAEYRRIEPDFVIIKDGVVLIVEVDGDTFHHESPAEAYVRTTMLENEGARIVRVQASDCNTPEKAAACARTVLQTISKLKVSSR